MKLRKLAGIILPIWREPSTCEACGAQFACGASLSGCWCAEIKLSDSVRDELRARYRRCLCRACLEGFAAGEAQTTDAKQTF